MRKTIYHLTAAGYVTFFLFSLLVPQNVNSSQMFHTIQTNSYYSVPNAQKHFNSIVNTLDNTQLDNLRIEKIGKFYSVRIGKFKDYTAAVRLLRTIKPKLTKAIVMEAYVKKERIVKSYSYATALNIKEPEKRSSSTTILDEVKSNTSAKTDSEVNGVPLKKKIEQIEALVRKKNYIAALDIIMAEIKEQPEHPDLNAWFGMVLLKMDKPLESLEYLKKATEQSPKTPLYHNGLGYSFFFLDRFDEAIDEFNKAIRLDPGHFDALTGLCIAYAKNDNQEKAMDIYHKIENLDKETANQLLTIIKNNFDTRY